MIKRGLHYEDTTIIYTPNRTIQKYMKRKKKKADRIEERNK